MKNNRGQVTIFIILAIVIVAAVILFFALKKEDVSDAQTISASLEPVYVNFLSCLEDDSLIGINVLESQGGYIELPDFEPGSAYMPFSSQLDFLGNPIPYWYYVSGNNFQKEQVPSKEDMEKQLEDFIEKRIINCDFSNYYEAGFDISKGEPRAGVIIRDNEVEVGLSMDLDISKAQDSVVAKNHKIIIKSNLGALYNSAKKIYEKEQEELFLENYGIDILRSYAPVDGVEITCSPKIWQADEIFDELEEAIEANTLALNVIKGESGYFMVDLPISSGIGVRFINSKSWPHTFEVDPSDGPVLMATPVGNQPGLGILGFCYVPYHFVYNVRYPVLVQVYEGDEIFQFPVAVVLQGNKPRQALKGSAVQIGVPELCKYKNTQLEINIYNTKLMPVDADISYKCLGEICNIGTASSGFLEGWFPQCVNGYIVVKAEGYENTKYLYSVISSGSVDIVLDKLYELDVELKLGGKAYTEDAIVSFVSDNSSRTVVYPEQKSVKLSEGQYEVLVYIYRSSNLKIPATIQQQCMEVPRSGLGGLFGLMQEKCFDVEIPEQDVSNALSGGGKQNYYILESELSGSSVIEISFDDFPALKTLEDLQLNYLLFEKKGLGILFK